MYVIMRANSKMMHFGAPFDTLYWQEYLALYTQLNHEKHASDIFTRLTAFCGDIFTRLTTFTGMVIYGTSNRKIDYFVSGMQA